MKIMIPLGNGSPWQDNELRYCLRSICKHLTGWNRIYIVGNKPDWLQANDSLIHIEHRDHPSVRNKEFNIHKKILAFINATNEKNDFLFMNDDHFLLEDIGCNFFPLHHKGPLFQCIQNSRHGNPYRITLQNTLNHLFMKGHRPMNYDTHCPIVYDAKAYVRVMPPKFPQWGYAIKTMYCTLAGKHGTLYPDLKLGKIMNIGDFDAAIQGRPYFSIGNQSIGAVLVNRLENLYPENSFWE